MTRETSTPIPLSIPPHVSPDRVSHFDFRHDEGLHADPHARLEELRRQGPALFTPYSRALTGPGTWIFTDGAAIRAIFQDPDSFASGGVRPFGQMVGDDWSLIPIDIDPPDHVRYRRMLNPLFSPMRMARLEPAITRRAAEIAAPLAGRERFDFVEEFAQPFPVSIFLELFGLPIDRLRDFVAFNDAILKGEGEEQVEAIRDLRDLLRGEVASRRKQPRDDLLSELLAARIEDRPLDADELTGLTVTLFLAGLDTVTSTLGYMFLYLAQHPEQQAMLRAQPDLIDGAVEELLRMFNVVMTARRATRDTMIGGVAIRKGDNVALPTSLISRDPGDVASPGQVDFARANNRHSAFGNGIHRCLGSHLARRELAAALRYWLTALPPFATVTQSRPRSTGIGVFSLTRLDLTWT